MSSSSTTLPSRGAADRQPQHAAHGALLASAAKAHGNAGTQRGHEGGAWSSESADGCGTAASITHDRVVEILVTEDALVDPVVSTT
jgi:hypothetical protein